MFRAEPRGTQGRRTSRTEGQVDVLAADLDGMGGHRLDGRHAERTARPDVEACPVAGTLDLAAEELPLGQGPAVVGADVVDGVEGAVDIEDGDGATLDV